MADGGEIYQKTISATVQGGSDNSVIIQPNYAYQKKFDFEGDWEEIKIGMFISYTNSVTDPNKSFTNGQANINSGGSTKDTFSYWGVIKDSPTKYLPDFVNAVDSNNVFVGGYYNLMTGIDVDDFSYNNVVGTGSNGLGGLCYSANTEVRNSSGSYKWFSNMPLTYTANSTSFASYWSIGLKINNKGASNQTITLQSYTKNNTVSSGVFSDVSLLNLMTLINTNTIVTNSDYNYTFPLNDGGSALPLPDSFFFYNAFLTVRPRIHALAVKKIS